MGKRDPLRGKDWKVRTWEKLLFQIHVEHSERIYLNSKLYVTKYFYCLNLTKEVNQA